MRSVIVVIACLLLHALAAEAAPPSPSMIRPLPTKLLASYAPLLERSELALVEHRDDGKLGQMTVIGYVAAPPELVHAIVADPAGYPGFLHNMSASRVERRPDGALVQHWTISFPVGSFSGDDEFRLEPGPRGAIEQRSLGQGKHGVTRWEFVPAPGGGTVVVNYGIYDPLDGLLARLVARSPSFEAGLDLAGALTMMRSLLAEARRRAAAGKVATAPPPPGTAPGFGPLLDRGIVNVVRSRPDGSLVDVSVVGRVDAPLPLVLSLLRAPSSWPGFVKAIKKVKVSERDPRGIEFAMTVAGFLVDVTTRYRLRYIPDGTDTLAVGGELPGGRYRWDLRADDRDGKAGTVMLWRGNIHIAAAGALVRVMLRLEPSFEHGVNLAVGLASMESMRARALQLAQRPAAK